MFPLIPNTFGIEARCRRLVTFDSEDSLKAELAVLDPAEPYIIVGQGSNLLPVGDFQGVVLQSVIKGMHVIAGKNEIFVRCGSGEAWDDVSAFCVSQGLYGTENLALIPGDVGASAVQNIGAYGVEAKDIIHEVEAVEVATGRTYTFSNADCQYSYRHSRFKDEWKNRFVITYVTYRLSNSFHPLLDYGNIHRALDERGIGQPTAQQLRDTIIAIRREKLPDPRELGNGGSFFMNPIISREHYLALKEHHPLIPHYDVDDSHVKVPAAWLIEQCGWKGKRLGNAGVYERQPLVLVNHGGATGKEIMNLCELIQHDVAETFGITILPEVNII